MKTLRSLLLVGLCSLSTLMFAQNPGQGQQPPRPQGENGPGRGFSIQELASQKAMELKPLLGLNETQVKAIYLIHISQLQEMQKEMEARRARMDSLRSRFGGQEAGQEGRQDGRQMHRQDGRRDSTAFQRGPRNDRGPGMGPNSPMAARMQKQRSQQDSLYKLVLTPEQYAQWQAYEKDRMEKMRQAMQERQGNRGGNPRSTGNRNDGFFDRESQNTIEGYDW